MTAWTSGLAIAPSGSIYVAGRLEHDNIPHRDYGWLLKVSPDGCFTTLCTTTSAQDVVDVEDVKIYPNPAHDYFEIDLPSLHESTKLIISDLYGRIVQKDDLTDIKTKMNCNFPPGIYFYSIFEKNTLLKSGKLVVN